MSDHINLNKGRRETDCTTWEKGERGAGWCGWMQGGGGGQTDEGQWSVCGV